MSDRDALEDGIAEPTPAADGPKREHPGCVLGVTFALVLLVVCIARIFTMPLGGKMDGTEELREIFGEAASLPGFELAEASVLPSGAKVLRLLPAEDGDAVTPGAPEEIVLFLYPSSAALEMVFHPPVLPSFGRPSGAGGPGELPKDPGKKLEVWERDPSFAWHTTIERDEITWFKWRASYAIERSMRKGGGWKESARVNLDQVLGEDTKRHLLLALQWPENEHVDKGVLKQVLFAVEMLEEPTNG